MIVGPSALEGVEQRAYAREVILESGRIDVRDVGQSDGRNVFSGGGFVGG